MKHILIPTRSAEDWKHGLADPEKQWKPGYSAHALAHCWESTVGFPPEVERLFSGSGIPFFQPTQLLLAVPEYTVDLPGGDRPSQSDLFVLGKCSDGRLVAITVEGKVRESFGPTLAEWSQGMSAGKAERLAYLQNILALPQSLPGQVRYQFLHRTASAVIEAGRFNARRALMIVHSFHPDRPGFEDFEAFVALFGAHAIPGQLVYLRDCHGISLYCGWVQGQAA